MRYYAVIFDRIVLLDIPENTGTVNYIGFHNDFVKPDAIQKWSHFLHTLYLIGTDWSVQELSEHFMKTAQAHGIPTLHLVLEVNLQSRFGWLPKDAWEWIDAEAKTQYASPRRRALPFLPSQEEKDDSC